MSWRLFELGLAVTSPEHEDGLRCHYDAGNYWILKASDGPPTSSA